MRIGAEALNATEDEKIRDLVIALMVQEPGDEPRRPRTPLLAPFITHDVLEAGSPLRARGEKSRTFAGSVCREGQCCHCTSTSIVLVQFLLVQMPLY